MKDKKLDIEFTDFCTLDYPCAYLEGKNTRMLYRYTSEATPEFCTSIVQRGWRRFGNFYFYPICAGCQECKSLRIDIKRFKISKSQKKAFKRNLDTGIIVRSPTISDEHIALYNKYHSWKASRDGWRNKEIDLSEYYENFAQGANEFGKEVLYIRDDKLVGVDLIDIVEDGISAIYFFYDPDYAYYSLGTFSLLYQIEMAKSLGLRYIYLGYWVDGCKAFAYKKRFSGLEILDGFPPLDKKPNWVPIED